MTGGKGAVSCKHLRPHLCKLDGLELVGRQGCSPHIKLYCRPRWADLRACKWVLMPESVVEGMTGAEAQAG